jgi:FtsP/CotA-like multicopper oxidase with cupredoxin domain
MMPDPKTPFHPTRRHLLGGISAMALAPALPVLAQERPPLVLLAKSDGIALRPDGPKTPIWSLSGPDGDVLRFRRGDRSEVTVRNELPVPVALDWFGLADAAQEPVLARASLAPNTQDSFAISWRQAGTLMSSISLLGDGLAKPFRASAVVVAESETATVDRDEVFLLEDWRVRPDGSAAVPGLDPTDALPVATINGTTSLDIRVRHQDRLRLRFINAFQRNVIAMKIENLDVRVMALDGQPTEPFSARNGAVVLAPGGRADVFIDVTTPAGSISQVMLHDGKEARLVAQLLTSNEPPRRSAPLPPAPALASNGLPERLDLKNALRVDIALGGAPTDWVPPTRLTSAAAHAFRVKPGRTVVLALVNRGNRPSVFHLHGHHFRLLDRLDDGWKPFWLDTLAVEPGQTQRIAFAAEHAGRWLMEAMATDWAAPRLVRWYGVE